MKLPFKIICFFLLSLPWPLQAAVLHINTATDELRVHVQEIFSRNQAHLKQLSGVDPASITIEIPADLAAFQQRIRQMGAPLWAAGVAQGSHIVVRPPRAMGGQDFAAVLLHELAHVYMNQAFKDQRPPWWLREGMAMLVARQNPGPIVMVGAVFNESLLGWNVMGRDFFPTAQQKDLAYAQAFYMTTFLQEKGLLAAVISGLAQGWDLNRCLHGASGKPLSYWEKTFKEEMSLRFSWMFLATDGAFWALIGLAAAVIVVWRRRRMLKQIRGQPLLLLNSPVKLRPLLRPQPRRKTIKIISPVAKAGKETNN